MRSSSLENRRLLRAAVRRRGDARGASASRCCSPFPACGRVLATLGVVLLLVAGLTPLGNALMLPLRALPAVDAARGAAGIIVLGGAVGAELSAARGTPDLNESAERITAAAALAQKYPQARIVYSGGNARLVIAGGIEADYAIQLLESRGVARGRVLA
jgi:uncharacterized SAM-binding protein YcdF (DUF218 family)